MNPYNKDEVSEDFYPGYEYQELFNLISETRGIPTIDEMNAIIEVVHKNHSRELKKSG
jgi:hypothetical protein